jgi:hypothetical protein
MAESDDLSWVSLIGFARRGQVSLLDQRVTGGVPISRHELSPALRLIHRLTRQDLIDVTKDLLYRRQHFVMSNKDNCDAGVKDGGPGLRRGGPLLVRMIR